MSKLLINEPPLQVLPSLAVNIGLNEALILQQLHYWLERSQTTHGGRKWVYNTMDAWGAQFPFWSPATIKRAFRQLVTIGVVEVSKLSPDKRDNTNYYAIDYDVLDDLAVGSNCASGDGQDDPVRKVKMTHSSDKTETTTETTTERAPRKRSAPATKSAEPSTSRPPASKEPPKPEGVEDGVWSDWLALRKAKRAPVTATVLATAEREAAKAGMSLNDFFTEWCLRGSQGLYADWLTPKNKNAMPTVNGYAVNPVTPSNLEAMQRVLAQRQGRNPDADTVDMEG